MFFASLREWIFSYFSSSFLNHLYVMVVYRVLVMSNMEKHLKRTSYRWHFSKPKPCQFTQYIYLSYVLKNSKLLNHLISFEVSRSVYTWLWSALLCVFMCHKPTCTWSPPFFLFVGIPPLVDQLSEFNVDYDMELTINGDADMATPHGKGACFFFFHPPPVALIQCVPSCTIIPLLTALAQ